MALRIKDNVDLKELEKFGFRNTKQDTYCKKIPNDNYKNFITNIVVNPVGTYFQNEIIVEIYDIDNSNEISDIDIGIKTDTLYDLIQAGLVEKVEE